MNIANQNNLDFYNSRVEQERRDLIALKKSGNYNLFNHLEQHPINELVKKGARLSDNHPLMKLRNLKSA